MRPEDWQRVKPILATALELDSAERASFLKEACADPSLREEIQSLLVAHEQAGAGALNSAALPSFQKSALSARLELSNGTRLGDFQILSLLGAGGMGEVYRARDLRLDRDVAIKVLPRFVSLDPERLRRFEQEAKAAAALNHPNILAVFHMGSYEDAPYLVSELLEGETLREQVKRGPLAPRKAIEYGAQIAHGLAAAHEKGIVHRNLKPVNLFVTREGRVKILDFGLAKLMHSESETQLTQRTLDTEPGAVMGTAGYMSPEQVRGLAADHRADIFAFGAILYEMLTGRRAFHKATSVETMGAILNEDPPLISQSTPRVPVALARAVHRCLEKNVEQRFQSASDLAFALEVSSDANSASTGDITPAIPRVAWRWVVGAGVVLALLSGALLWRSRVSARLTEKDSVVLSDFANTTGDPIFDDTLRQGLSAALRQSPFLNVLSDSKVSATLKLMTRPVNTVLTPEVAREVCLRANSKAWIGGSVAGMGREYVVGLKAVNCQNGDTLAQEQVTAANKEQVLDALGQAASKLRGELGESLANVQKFDVPLRQATTPSLEALKAFSVGRKALYDRGSSAALPFFQHAVELDPNFASGYASLGKTYSSLREYTRAKELFTKAYSLREHASEREKFDIESMYQSDVRGDLENTIRVFREWLASYPRDETALGNLAYTYAALRNYEQGADLSREALQQNPNDVIAYANVAAYQMLLGQFPESRKTIQEAFDHKLDATLLHYVLYTLGFLTGDERPMADQVTWSERTPDPPPVLLLLQSSKEAYYGRLKSARELNRRAVESLERSGRKERAALERMSEALREGALGNLTEVRQGIISPLNQSTVGQEAEENRALILAWLGEAARAESLLDELNKQSPEGTIMQSVVLPTVRAEMELSNKKPERSIELLRAAAPYELTVYAFSAAYEGCVYVVYIRGQAYLALKEGAAAEREFQKIIGHPGIVRACETAPLARLGLGRAYAMQGDTEKARAKYQDFLALWKDADSDIPILKEAKAEYAKLQ
jgi:serine/threonine protein kinase/tetratricopeptide (TPR) repeat protein